MAQGNSTILYHTARNSTNPKFYKFLIKLKRHICPGWCNLYRVALRSVGGWLAVGSVVLVCSVWLAFLCVPGGVVMGTNTGTNARTHHRGCVVSDFLKKSCKKFFLGRKVERRRNVYALTSLYRRF